MPGSQDKRWTTGRHAGSRELREKIEETIKGLEVTIQAKEDVMIHREGREHNDRLRKFLARPHNKW